MNLCTWHIIRENDALSTKNGSALLTVAKALQVEDKRLGGRSYIVGSDHPDNDLPDALGLLRCEQQPLHRRLADATSKLLIGETRLHSTRIASESGAHEFPDLVVAHNQPWLIDGIRHNFPEASTVLYIHNRLLQGMPRLAGRRQLRKFDSLVCVSDYIRRDLEKRYGPFSDDFSYVVRNGVDSDRFDRKADAPSVMAGPDILFVGRVVAEKGPQVLLAALEQLAVRGVLPTTQIVGSTGFDPSAPTSKFELDLRSVVKENGLAVSFKKAVGPSTIPTAMNSARVIVVPSVWPDPCPLVVLEALASSAALVTTLCGGIPEIVGDGAVVVRAQDPSALASALEQLLTDEAKRSDIADGGRRIAGARSWKKVHSEYRIAAGLVT